MINYLSTRNKNTTATPTMAILNGLAPDGGLYVPSDLSALKIDYRDVINMDYRGMARVIFGRFFPDFGEEEIARIVEASYADKFTAEEITPLVPVGDRYVLELFHGPTCAFKDVALSALPNFMVSAARLNDFNDEILILTATSGDTGSAALHGFSDVPGTRIIVFYPEHGISDSQRLQMTTQQGKNTCACAVRGNFDDAQNGVKRIFTEIPHPAEGVSLSSANSINIGRLVPQVVYYFAAYAALVKAGRIQAGDPVDYTVPTGNFGDIMAGFFAREMGLPVGRLVCASNKNDVLTEFLTTGHYNRVREFHKTTSPSMDILISSNLERLLYFVCGPEQTASYMKALSETGEYTITEEELAKIQSLFTGICASEEEGASAIGEVFREHGYLLDTHTSIAWAAAEKYQGDSPNVILSTASPYKFSRAVMTAIGMEPTESDQENMQKLEAGTGIAAPAPLKAIFQLEVRHKDVIEKDEMMQYVKDRSVR